MNPKIRSRVILAVSLIIPLAICGKIAWTKIEEAKFQKRLTHIRQNVWPTERKETEQKVKERQAVAETKDAVTISLKPYINAKLAEAPMCWKGNNANNLSALPAGTNVYAGIPFDVEGSIQLMGRWLLRYGKKYPERVDAIPVTRKCSKIHLLHGTGGITEECIGKPIAKLVLHYEDESTKEINMIAGQQAFDWWIPTFKTANMHQFSSGTELAWIGSNQHLQKWAPDLSLCLFRTSFENPQPDMAVASVDFVSTMTVACPFLVGVTVE